jgi:hypothetical protein
MERKVAALIVCMSYMEMLALFFFMSSIALYSIACMIGLLAEALLSWVGLVEDLD